VVEYSIVDRHMEKAIRFFDKQDKGAKGGLKEANDFLGDVGFNVLFKDLKFCLKKIINRTENRIEFINWINMMIEVNSIRRQEMSRFLSEDRLSKVVILRRQIGKSLTSADSELFF